MITIGLVILILMLLTFSTATQALGASSTRPLSYTLPEHRHVVTNKLRILRLQRL